jgi:acetyl-CoA carboxylase carboxyltransferase component
MIELCTRFHIPLLTITDTDGYNTDSATEKFLPGAAERMVRALTASDVPKINLVTGSIVGSAYSMMNSKGIGADYVFMWEDANVSIVEPRQATEVIFGKWSSDLEKQFRDTQSSAVALARHGFADKVITPEDSRKYLIGALQTFVNSR